MAAPLIRRLSTTRRHVALDHADEYLLAWDAVRRAVASLDGRAWVFRGVGHEDRFIEFIEWTAGAADPLADPAVIDALAQLDTFAAAGAAEQWEQAQ